MRLRTRTSTMRLYASGGFRAKQTTQESNSFRVQYTQMASTRATSDVV